MSVASFIPELWSAEMLTQFRQQAIFAGLVDRHWEGQLVRGNKLHIPFLTEVAIKDYKAAGRTTAADKIASTSIELDIDQEKSFDFLVDDVDKAQVAGSLGAYTGSAAWGIANDADLFLATLAISQGTDVSDSATALTTSKQAWDMIRTLRLALNKAKVPQGDRQIVFNAEFEHLLLDSESKLTSAQVSGTTEGLRSAAIGRILGFDSYTTENMPETNKPQIVAFSKSAIGFVSQVQEVEAMRANDSFSDRLRGLHVYGGKIVRPTAVAHATSI